jgi:hypothetical protein
MMLHKLRKSEKSIGMNIPNINCQNIEINEFALFAV